MTPLRRRMIDDMTLRNFTPKTIQAYVDCVARFARHFGTLTRAPRAPSTSAPTCSTSSRSDTSPPATYNQTRCALQIPLPRSPWAGTGSSTSLARAQAARPSSRSSSASTRSPASSPPSPTSSIAPSS